MRRILYAGDSAVGGAANYLLGVLRALRAGVRHVPPAATLTPQVCSQRYDAIILSDFPRRHAPPAAQRRIAAQVCAGTGLLMIGGWGSFGHGGWQGSLIARLLPVRCTRRDDRIHCAGGAWITPHGAAHPILRRLSFKVPPAICGFNAVRATPAGRILLTARPLVSVGGRPRLARTSYPLLVIGAHGRGRTAALATDVAPHWCGGLVDWGNCRLRLPVTRRIHIEVGQYYARLLTNLCAWLAR